MNTLKKLLTLCLLLGVVVAISACAHEHKFTTEWESDARLHWHACQTEDCAEKSHRDEHAFAAGVVTTPATEEAEGVMTYRCMVCEYKKTEVIEKLPHTHKLTVVDEVPASCTKEGTKAYYTCSGCDVIFADADGVYEIDAPEAIEKLAHSFTSYVSDGNATCEKDGTKTAKCDGCDETDTVADEGSIKDHTPAEAVKENEVGATCSTNGSYESVIYCSNEHCKEELSRETVTVPATGEHVYVTEQEKVEATCTEDGYVVMACGCGETETTTLTATGHSYESKVTAPTCTEAGYTTYTCHCDDTYTADEVAALGHNWSGLALATAPTYEAVGAISGTCANCDATSIEIPAVSAENGYTALITGVLTRWQYTYNDFTFTVDLANSNAVTNTYSYGVEAWYVGLNAEGKPIMENGYKSTTATWNTTFFGGSGKTYYTTITASKATTVTLILSCARNYTKPFFTAGDEHCIDNLMVNSSTYNVIRNMSASLTGGGKGQWYKYYDCAIATIFLKEGDNSISFSTATTVNIKGIGFIAANDVNIYLAPIPEETNKTHNFIAFENDPFISENGGSISGTVDVTDDTPRYENTRGQTFTTTITVSEDTWADFIIKVESGTADKYINTYKGLFSFITLDGDSVAINDCSVIGKGWGVSIDIIVARLNLTKGTHVITFTRTTDTTDKNNYNIWGVGFITPPNVDIALGSAETEAAE